MPDGKCSPAGSVAAQEEGVAGGSSHAVTQAADARAVFQSTALSNITLQTQQLCSVSSPVPPM